MVKRWWVMGAIAALLSGCYSQMAGGGGGGPSPSPFYGPSPDSTFPNAPD